MGNVKSQQCQQRKPLYLFYLIHRTWCIVVDHRKSQDRCNHTDGETDLSSKCSSCKDCDYRQDSLIFDSEAEMAPNAEEELLVVKPWGAQSEKQERLRPPTYNAEDYAIALRRWGRRPLGSVQDSQGTLPSTTSSSSGYASGSGEMTLRQFTSVSELLNKLRADLRLAFPSFVQEFASPPADGVTLLLETLRGVQLAQSTPPGSGQTGPRMGSRRAALDELGCVECLAACAERSPDAGRLLVQAQPGLLALAVCLTSSLNRSRVLALQLLTKVCQTPGGHTAVSEAVSTLRLRYGEGGRFRFLAGALLAPRAAIALRVAGVSFLNAFLKSAPRSQTRLYIQAEACEAGLEPQVLQQWLREVDGHEEEALTDLLHKEVQKWSHNCVDVEMLQRRAARAEDTCRVLSKKISALQSQVQKLQLEKMNNYNNMKDRKKSVTNINAKEANKVSSNAEDEGISSSERSSSPEDTKHASSQSRPNLQSNNAMQDNDQETTIDDVIEELRIIVKDAEEEFDDKNQVGSKLNHRALLHGNECRLLANNNLCRSNSKVSLNNSESYLYEKVATKRDSREHQANSKAVATSLDNSALQNQSKGEQVTYFGNEDYSIGSDATRRLSTDSRRISKSSVEGSVKIMVKGPDVEEAIVPAILHPQPPRRSPPCLSTIMAVRNVCDFVDPEEAYHSHDDEIEEETLGDGSDSLLSASRLKYNGKHETYEQQNSNVDVQKPFRNSAILITAKENINKMSKSFDDLRHFGDSVAGDRKSLRNYETNSSKIRIACNIGPFDKRHLDSYKSFETLKTYEPVKHANEHTVVHKHSQKYRNDAEKRKMLRRSASHDYLESSTSSPRSRRSGGSSRIECQIRKFESLNSFDDQRSLQNYGLSRNVDNLTRHFQDMFRSGGGGGGGDSSKSKMRRSESFHHVSHHKARKDQQCSSRGGSDSGLFYVTDYNLEPFLTRRPKSIEAPKSPSLLTKSLDRIDEGLDSLVDIVITEEKNQWGIGRHRLRPKKSKDDKQVSRSKSNRSDNKSSKKEDLLLHDRFLKNDELYNGHKDISLRNDEFYEDERNRLWIYENEVNCIRKSRDFDKNDTDTDTDTPMILLPASASRHGTNGKGENINNKFLSRSNDTGIFAGRTYDTFGLGKNRFNAGKYSGNQIIKDDVTGRRSTTSAVIGTRGKVTDVISGLY